MKIVKIKQERQENGLWGTPFNCFKMSGTPPFGDEYKLKLQSAIIVAFNERYNRRFEIINNSFSNSFYIKAHTDMYNLTQDILFNVHYNIYEVIEDTLYEFEDEKEHNSFLRKNKIKQLEENNV